MYRVIRIIDGVTEVFKDSNSHLDKTFSDSVAAELQAKKLNMNLILFDRDPWTIEQI